MRATIALIVFLIGTAGAAGATTRCATSGTVTDTTKSLAQATNALRSRHGAEALPLDTRLNRVAQAHACDIARKGKISHTGSNGSMPINRVKRIGYRACFVAENLAMGTMNAGKTVTAWQDLPGHARNQNDKRAKAMGFGFAHDTAGRPFWVGVYAAPCRRRS